MVKHELRLHAVLCHDSAGNELSDNHFHKKHHAAHRLTQAYQVMRETRQHTMRSQSKIV